MTSAKRLPSWSPVNVGVIHGSKDLYGEQNMLAHAIPGRVNQSSTISVFDRQELPAMIDDPIEGDKRATGNSFGSSMHYRRSSAWDL